MGATVVFYYAYQKFIVKGCLQLDIPGEAGRPQIVTVADGSLQTRRSVASCATSSHLLDGMCQLVGQKLLSLRRPWRVLPCPEHHIPPDGVGQRVYGPRRFDRPTAG